MIALLSCLTALVACCMAAPQFHDGFQQHSFQPPPFQSQQQHQPSFPQHQPSFHQPQQQQHHQPPQQQKQHIIPANVFRGIGKDGSQNFAFQTADGQMRSESLGADGSVKGSYSYAGPDGKIITINYKADKNGFHASGPTLPTPPPLQAPAAAAQHEEPQTHQQSHFAPPQSHFRPQPSSSGHFRGGDDDGDDGRHFGGNFRSFPAAPSHHQSFQHQPQESFHDSFFDSSSFGPQLAPFNF